MDAHEITKNLSTFKFDTGGVVEDCFQSMLKLRNRSYLLTCNMIGHSTFFIGLVNEINKSFNLKKNETNDLKVGLLGCGRIAVHLINSLLEYSNISPTQIYVSSRSNESFPVEFKEMGINYCSSNIEVVKKSAVAFLCCLSTHAEEILDEIKCEVGNCYIYSFVVGIPAPKIRRLLHSNKVFKPHYSFNVDAVYNNTLIGCCDIKKALALLDVREITCPVQLPSDIKPVELGEDFILLLLSIPLLLNIRIKDHVEVAHYTFSLVYDNFQNLKNCDKLVTILSNWYIDVVENEYSSLYLNKLKEETSNYVNESEFILSQKIRYKSFFDRFSNWNNSKI